MIEHKNAKDGQCPLCQCDDYKIKGPFKDGGTVYYSCKCTDCGYFFNIYYNLTFSGIWGDEPSEEEKETT